jgi:hypothetical protein
MVRSTTSWGEKIGFYYEAMKQKAGLDTNKRLTNHSARNVWYKS